MDIMSILSTGITRGFFRKKTIRYLSISTQTWNGSRPISERIVKKFCISPVPTGDIRTQPNVKGCQICETRRGIQLHPQRQVAPSRGIEYADCATILGGTFTQGTFAFAKKPIIRYRSQQRFKFPAPEKDFDKIRKNFLWLGSTGMVHKGLDLVLEVFSQLPGLSI